MGNIYTCCWQFFQPPDMSIQPFEKSDCPECSRWYFLPCYYSSSGQVFRRFERSLKRPVSCHIFQHGFIKSSAISSEPRYFKKCLSDWFHTMEDDGSQCFLVTKACQDIFFCVVQKKVLPIWNGIRVKKWRKIFHFSFQYIWLQTNTIQYICISIETRGLKG